MARNESWNTDRVILILRPICNPPSRLCFVVCVAVYVAVCVVLYVVVYVAHNTPKKIGF